jgi:hypothetical protein
MANKAVHPYRVGKLVAINMQWVTAVQGCEGRSVWLYNGWCTAYGASSKLPYVGFLQSTQVCEACLHVHTDCKLLAFTLLCGTPHFTLIQFQIQTNNTTLCSLSLNQPSIHLNVKPVLPVILNILNFNINLLSGA